MTFCRVCAGTGEVEETRDALPTEANGGLSEESRYVLCETCGGTGLEIEEVVLPQVARD